MCVGTLKSYFAISYGKSSFRFFSFASFSLPYPFWILCNTFCRQRITLSVSMSPSQIWMIRRRTQNNKSDCNMWLKMRKKNRSDMFKESMTACWKQRKIIHVSISWHPCMRRVVVGCILLSGFEINSFSTEKKRHRSISI